MQRTHSLSPYPAHYNTDMTDLIPEDLKAQMIRNHYDVTERGIENHTPVIKLHIPSFAEGNRPTWLLSELDPFYDDIAFGLCDKGVGFLELGNVSIDEITSVNHPLSGAPLVERDETFVPSYPMSVYAQAARMCQRITVDPDQLAHADKALKRTLD